MDERARLAALRRYEVLDTPKEPAFDHVTRVVARVLDVPIALVSLVDADRQWFKACIGLDVSEVPRSDAFCAHAIEQTDAFAVADAREDPRFADNPLVTGPPHIRSYAGAALITPDGFRIGTLCAIDRRPRKHSESELATLVDLARIVVEILETRLSARQQRVLAKISALSSDAAYVYDVERGRTIWQSDRAPAIFGFDLLSPPAAVVERVHPDDRAVVATLWNPPPGTSLAEPVLYRMRIADAYRWFLSRRSVLDVDASGAARTIVGVVSDVTDLKRAEGRAHASESELAQRLLVLEGVLDAAAEAIVYVDGEGTVRLTNRFARELLGENTTGVVPPPPEHVRRVGIYSEDGERLLEPHELPMARALRGERVDSLPLMIRNARFPAGIRLLANTRIVRHPDGRTAGAVLSLVDMTAELAAAAAIRDSLREKEALLREIHHRVKNNLAVIASLLYLQAEAVEDDHARAALRDSRERVHAIALAHEHLYRASDLGRVELGGYIAALMAHVVSSMGAEARGVEITVEHPHDLFVSLDAAHPCGLIANELVTNALKHAFPEARPGTVCVTVEGTDDEVALSVRDDGVGMPEVREPGSGIGMQLVRELTMQLQGTLTLAPANPGTIAKLRFPRTPA